MHPAINPEIEPVIVHRRNARRGKMRMFYAFFSIFAVLAVVAGFFTRYFAPLIEGNFKPKPFVHVHAVMFFTWIVIAVLQPVLIRVGRKDLHKKLGIPSAFLAAGMVVIGCLLAITSARIKGSNGSEEIWQSFLLVQFSDMFLFALFVSLAIINYKRPESHKRLMLLGTLSLLPPAFSRFYAALGVDNSFTFTLTTIMLCLLAGAVHDYFTRKRIHSVYIWGGAFLLLVWISVRLYFRYTDWWMSIAGWVLK